MSYTLQIFLTITSAKSGTIQDCCYELFQFSTIFFKLERWLISSCKDVSYISYVSLLLYVDAAGLGLAHGEMVIPGTGTVL